MPGAGRPLSALALVAACPVPGSQEPRCRVPRWPGASTSKGWAKVPILGLWAPAATRGLARARSATGLAAGRLARAYSGPGQRAPLERPEVKRQARRNSLFRPLLRHLSGFVPKEALPSHGKPSRLVAKIERQVESRRRATIPSGFHLRSPPVVGG